MKIVEQPHPKIKSFSVMPGAQGLETFKKSIKENKKMGVDVDFETKTSVRISLQAGSARYGADNQSDYSKENNFKFLVRDEINYLWGEKVHREYFKLLKKQGKPELMKHVESLVKDALYRMGLTEYIDELTVYVSLPKELL